MSDRPKIIEVRRVGGIAGQTEWRATVQYDGWPPSSVSFVGSEVYGGPVVMVTDGGQVFVREPDRFGKFGKEWVCRFFGQDESGCPNGHGCGAGHASWMDCP